MKSEFVHVSFSNLSSWGFSWGYSWGFFLQLNYPPVPGGAHQMTAAHLHDNDIFDKLRVILFVSNKIKFIKCDLWQTFFSRKTAATLLGMMVSASSTPSVNALLAVHRQIANPRNAFRDLRPETMTNHILLISDWHSECPSQLHAQIKPRTYAQCFCGDLNDVKRDKKSLDKALAWHLVYNHTTLSKKPHVAMILNTWTRSLSLCRSSWPLLSAPQYTCTKKFKTYKSSTFPNVRHQFTSWRSKGTGKGT